MTETMLTGRLIRPKFFKWSAITFVLLLPFVFHSAWNYYENRQLADAIRAIEQHGEPTRLPDPHFDADSSESERDYRAAAVLASGFLLDTQASLTTVVAASQRNEWPSDVAPLRSAVHTYETALEFADRAADLPFHGFRVGTTYAARTSDLLSVQRLSGYRAIVRAVDGDSDGAIASLATAARLGRPLIPYAYSQRLRVPDVVQVLERTKASGPALARLGAAFDDLGDDGDLSTWFQELRRNYLTGPRGFYGRPRLGTLALVTVLQFDGPWATHVLNGQLRTFAELVAAAKKPWPGRIDRTMAIDAEGIFPSNVPGSDAIRQAQSSLQAFVLGSASQTAGFRALRIAIAVEQYRRAHSEQLPETLASLTPDYARALPVDPFSGRDLLMKKDSDGYSIYSVGANRTDDGGKDLSRAYVPFPAQPAADIGVRLQTTSARGPLSIANRKM